MDIHEHQWAAQREELSRRIDPLISTTHDSSYHATGLPGMRCIPLTKVARCPSPALLPPLPESDAALLHMHRSALGISLVLRATGRRT